MRIDGIVVIRVASPCGTWGQEQRGTPPHTPTALALEMAPFGVVLGKGSREGNFDGVFNALAVRAVTTTPQRRWRKTATLLWRAMCPPNPGLTTPLLCVFV